MEDRDRLHDFVHHRSSLTRCNVILCGVGMGVAVGVGVGEGLASVCDFSVGGGWAEESHEPWRAEVFCCELFGFVSKDRAGGEGWSWRGREAGRGREGGGGSIAATAYAKDVPSTRCINKAEGQTDCVLLLVVRF